MLLSGVENISKPQGVGANCRALCCYEHPVTAQPELRGYDRHRHLKNPGFLTPDVACNIARQTCRAWQLLPVDADALPDPRPTYIMPLGGFGAA